jgi:DNA replication protein DnaC
MQLGTEAEACQLTEVLDLRYRNVKPTLVITNCTKDELPRYLGDRGLDRLRESSGKAICFDWQSYRASH